MPTPINDHPTLTCTLKRTKLVEEVAASITSSKLPHVFGIHGDWGAGKTSFLWQLQYHLTGHPPQAVDFPPPDPSSKLPKGTYENSVAVVWFEAWRYQHDEAPIVALLHEIRSQLPTSAKWLNTTKKLGEIAIRSAFSSLEDLTKKIGIQVSRIEKVAEKWEKDHLAVALPSHTIREHLDHAIGQLLEGNKDRRIVVLIDDLDRCEPKAAFRLLEGIKIYLILKQCVFVLGMDQRVIESAISRSAPGTQDAQGIPNIYRAREYLDKLCQTTYFLPKPPMPDLFYALLRSAFEPNPPNRIAEFKLIVDEFPHCLPSNPRRLKAFAHVLSRFIAMHLATTAWPDLAGAPARKTTAPRDTYLLFVLATLHYFHHDAYRRLETDPQFYLAIRNWIGGTASDHPSLQGVILPTKVSGGSGPPGSTPQLTQTYPDHSRDDVFRIQPVMSDLGTVTEGEVRNFLL